MMITKAFDWPLFFAHYSSFWQAIIQYFVYASRFSGLAPFS